MNHATPTPRSSPRLATPTDLGANATKDIAAALNGVLADTFALYLKTKNFHWHVSGPHFRDYHLLLDEQADQIFATTDVIAERVRKIGRKRCARSATSRAISGSPTTTRSMSTAGHAGRTCATTISAWSLRCARRTACATSTRTSPPRACWRPSSTRPRRRVWFLYEAGRKGDSSGH